MSKEKVIVGVLAGVATGALLGLLFAPDKGSKTRNKISKASKDSVNSIKDKFSDLMDNIVEKFEGEKKQITGAYDKAVSKVSEFSRDRN